MSQLFPFLSFFETRSIRISMASSMPLSSEKRYLFQVNQHVQASLMLLSIMDSADIEINNTLLSSSSAISISNSDDYENGLRWIDLSFFLYFFLFFVDLRLAAELGRCLLERNQELQNYINVLHKQIDDKQCDMKVRWTLGMNALNINFFLVPTYEISLYSRAAWY